MTENMKTEVYWSKQIGICMLQAVNGNSFILIERLCMRVKLVWST
jgi:hypothetical protein